MDKMNTLGIRTSQNMKIWHITTPICAEFYAILSIHHKREIRLHEIGWLGIRTTQKHEKCR